MSQTTIPLAILAIFTIVSFVISGAIAKKVRWISFRVLMIVNYTVSTLVSGIVHILNSSASRRGYFDAVQQLDSGEWGLVVLVSIAGLIALVAGAMFDLPRTRLGPRKPAALRAPDRTMLSVLTAIILPVSLLALVRIRDHVSTLETFGSRVISISGGMARYSYVSYWVVWAITFTVILLVFRTTPTRHRSGDMRAILLVATGVVAIGASLEWNGGRSAMVGLAFPLVLVTLPLVRVSKAVGMASAVAASLAYVGYVYQLTERRMTRQGISGPLDWLDWEWGRFSMLGFAVQHSKENGFVFGETLINSVLRFFEGTFRLVGIPYEPTGTRTTPAIAAEHILHSSTNFHIMPGLTPELYLNFGLVGVIGGYFFLGRLCGWTDARFENSTSTIVVQLFWAFLGSLLVFRTVNLDSGSAFITLIWVGAPLIFAAVLSRISAKGTRGDPPPVAATAATGTSSRSPMTARK